MRKSNNNNNNNIVEPQSMFLLSHPWSPLPTSSIPLLRYTSCAYAKPWYNVTRASTDSLANRNNFTSYNQRVHKVLNTCSQNLWSLIICDVQPENITTTTEWHRRCPPPRGPASVFRTLVTWHKHRESSPGTGAAGTRREYRARLVCYAHSGPVRRITQQPNTSDIHTESGDVIHHS